MVVAKVVVVATVTGAWNVIPVVAKLSTYSFVAASEFCKGSARPFMMVLLRTILPAGVRFKFPDPVLIVNAAD